MFSPVGLVPKLVTRVNDAALAGCASTTSTSAAISGSTAATTAVSLLFTAQLPVQVGLRPAPLPVPWKPNSVDWPAATLPL
jgi:hypothetical protein